MRADEAINLLWDAAIQMRVEGVFDEMLSTAGLTQECPECDWTNATYKGGEDVCERCGASLEQVAS